jgi:hypothetical protein
MSRSGPLHIPFLSPSHLVRLRPALAAQEGNLTHPELYITHSNRAAAYLNLGLYEEALWDARRCQVLAEAQFARNHERSAAPSYIKGFVRKVRFRG